MAVVLFKISLISDALKASYELKFFCVPVLMNTRVITPVAPPPPPIILIFFVEKVIALHLQQRALQAAASVTCAESPFCFVDSQN